VGLYELGLRGGDFFFAYAWFLPTPLWDCKSKNCPSIIYSYPFAIVFQIVEFENFLVYKIRRRK